MNSMLVRNSCLKWRVPDDFMTRDHFERVVRELVEVNSSPGYPHCLQHTSNKTFFGFDETGEPSEARMDYVWILVCEHVSKRYADPIRLFIKPEPHTLKKIYERRFRLISSVSVVDAIIDHMLFGEMNKKMVENYYKISAKVGWSQYNMGWTRIPLSGQSSDKSGWDWTVKSWLIAFMFQLRLALCENPTADWYSLAEFRYYMLFGSPLFVTSGGFIFKQTQPGVMKSGCVNTIADNSLMQEVLDLRVCFEVEEQPGWLMSMGDDVYQKKRSDRYWEAISKYCILKTKSDTPDFAGCLFKPTLVEPLYHGKHCYRLLHVPDKDAQDTALSYCLFYHKSEKKDQIRKILSDLNVQLPTDEWCEAIYDGVE